MKLKNVELCFKTESRSLLDIYNPKTGVVKVQPPKWKRILRGLWPYKFLSHILFLWGQNQKIFTRDIVALKQILIWDPTMPWIKKL